MAVCNDCPEAALAALLNLTRGQVGLVAQHNGCSGAAAAATVNGGGTAGRRRRRLLRAPYQQQPQQRGAAAEPRGRNHPHGWELAPGTDAVGSAASAAAARGGDGRRLQQQSQQQGTQTFNITFFVLLSAAAAAPPPPLAAGGSAAPSATQSMSSSLPLSAISASLANALGLPSGAVTPVQTSLRPAAAEGSSYQWGSAPALTTAGLDSVSAAALASGMAAAGAAALVQMVAACASEAQRTATRAALAQGSIVQTTNAALVQSAAGLSISMIKLAQPSAVPAQPPPLAGGGGDDVEMVLRVYAANYGRAEHIVGMLRQLPAPGVLLTGGQGDSGGGAGGGFGGSKTLGSVQGTVRLAIVEAPPPPPPPNTAPNKTLLALLSLLALPCLLILLVYFCCARLRSRQQPAKDNGSPVEAKASDVSIIASAAAANQKPNHALHAPAPRYQQQEGLFGLAAGKGAAVGDASPVGGAAAAVGPRASLMPKRYMAGALRTHILLRHPPSGLAPPRPPAAGVAAALSRALTGVLTFLGRGLNREVSRR